VSDSTQTGPTASDPASATSTNASRPSTLDEDDVPRARWERAVGWAIVGACTLVVLWIMSAGLQLWPLGDIHFGDLFANTTTNGGDMGAHVWWPKFLAEHWFPKGRLAGWAPDWYGGFPVGQYYFPLPAIFVAILDVFLPYNVAFKLVTASGPLLVPAAAYSFARGMRAPWPAPPAFAVAALGMLVQTRNDWQIYGGNIASTLAGEFSFTLGLAFGLFALGALAYTLDTGRRRWLPVVLIAATIMCHIVVCIFIAIAATLLWLVRRPLRTWRLAVPIGATAVALSGVWLIPLLGQHGQTQSMRYTKSIPHPRSAWDLPSWIPLPGPIAHTVEGIVNGISPSWNGTAITSPTLWIPGWIWLLAAVAIICAGWYRRRSTLVVALMALVFAVLFIQWPEHAVWNTRFLPFWLLSMGFLAAMGATELCRLAATGVRWAHDWIRDGDLQDARSRAWADIARAPEGEVTQEQRDEAVAMLSNRRFDTGPEGWEPPEQLRGTDLAASSRRAGAIALAIITAAAAAIGINRAWDARDNNPSVSIAGWARWNYAGYEKKDAWPEYHDIMTTMDTLAPGRALWEPSAKEGDPINNYGTSLALELLPYWTDGRIGSMEGLYFESTPSTSFHFLTVAECAKYPSNPVRGLDYGNLDDDFDQCVRHLQMLGVRYLMLWTPEAQAKADAASDLRLVRTIDDVDGFDPKGWKVYEVADSALVEGLSSIPVVATTHGGTYSECWGKTWPDVNSAEPELPGWECDTAGWWRNRDLIDKPYAQDGPEDWERIDFDDLADTELESITPAKVTDIDEDVDKISFTVDEIGKPVVVKTSYYPNWEAHGAEGPYRLSPNLMVVVPTEHEVTLTYGLTGVDWLGRIATLLGIVGLVLLIRWKGATRYAANAEPDEEPTDEASGGPDDGPPDGPPEDPGDPDDEPGPDREAPAPALP
jgi:hypothetical protein